MSGNVEKLIQDAVTQSESWHSKGWKATFGPRKTEVNNSTEAKALPSTFNYRLEAISYWNRVEAAGKESAQWGRRALDSLKKGDKADAVDSVFFAMFLEKTLNEKAPTWRPVYDSIK